MTIHKYSLSVGANEIEMPANSSVLTVQVYNYRFMLWAIVNPDAPMKKRKFMVVLTGEILPDNCKDKNYVATIQDGAFVYHIFDTSY